MERERGFFSQKGNGVGRGVKEKQGLSANKQGLLDSGSTSLVDATCTIHMGTGSVNNLGNGGNDDGDSKNAGQTCPKSASDGVVASPSSTPNPGKSSSYANVTGKPRRTKGKSSYSRAMIELRADVKLRDNIVVAMPKIIGKGIYTCAGETMNLKKPSQTLRGVPVGPKIGFKPAKQVYQPVSKKLTANTSGNKKKNVMPNKEVRKPLENVDYSGDYDSGDEVASEDNDMASFLAKKDGYGTNSLLEQCKESHEDDDYDYDSYDDDMYEGQEINKKI
nr:hypothetical protein [Tanacetum cinerariifolium]